MESLLEALTALVLGVAVIGGAIWLYHNNMERQFGWLRSRIEEPEEVYDLDEVMEEANSCLE